MAVGKGSINRVSKAVDDKVIAPVEAKEEAPTKAEPVKKTTTATKTTAVKKATATKATATKRTTAAKKTTTAAKKTTTAKKTTAAKKPVAKKVSSKAGTVAKPNAQVDKMIGKKDEHYGLGSSLPTFLM